MPSPKMAQTDLAEISTDDVRKIVQDLRRLYSLPRCRTDTEVEKRISEYFEICDRQGMRPGIEQLSLALGISRVTFFNWCRGVGCSKERQQIAEKAHQIVIAYIENATLSGRLNPASSCFFLKNWAQYRDVQTVEAVVNSPMEPEKTPAEIEQEIISEIPLDD